MTIIGRNESPNQALEGTRVERLFLKSASLAAPLSLIVRRDGLAGRNQQRRNENEEEMLGWSEVRGGVADDACGVTSAVVDV